MRTRALCILPAKLAALGARVSQAKLFLVIVYFNYVVIIFDFAQKAISIETVHISVKRLKYTVHGLFIILLVIKNKLILKGKQICLNSNMMYNY